MVLRVMTPYFHLGQDKNFPPIDEYTPKFRYQTAPTPLDHLYTMGPVVDVRKQKTNDLIRELGAAGTVLLKNTNGVLPLKKPMNVGVFGNDAADLTDGASSLIFAKTGILGGEHDIGTLTVGGGSGGGRNTYLVSPLEAIKQRAHAYGALVQYITNNDAIVRGYLAGIAPPPEVCLVFLKTYATEGKDRTSLLAEWSSTEVVTKVTAICQNTVVVLHGAAPNVLPWANNPNVTAIIAAHMPGQETGNSIVDILWGDVNPSGKLPYTIANREEDYNRNLLNDTALRTTTDPDAWQEDFVEGNLIDYKEFDAKNASVLYEFGFGLSYTTFALSDLDVRVDVKNAPRRPDSRAPILPGGNADLWKNLASVSVSVKNSGKVSGSAVPQVYLTYPDEAGAPVKSLRGFEKVELRAGAKKTVKFSLTRRDLSYWNTITQDWTLPQGKILVNVGFSSRNLPLKREISI
jgi:beta-glucosidase